MGHVIHHAIIATTFGADYAGKLLKTCLALGASAVVVPSLVNAYHTVFVGPDGSKSGWPESDHGDKLRALIKRELAAFNYEDGSNPFEWVEVCYSSDDESASITDSRWPNTGFDRSETHIADGDGLGGAGEGP